MIRQVSVLHRTFRMVLTSRQGPRGRCQFSSKAGVAHVQAGAHYRFRLLEPLSVPRVPRPGNAKLISAIQMVTHRQVLLFKLTRRPRVPRLRPTPPPHILVALGCAYVEQHDVNLNVYEDAQACQGVFADGTLGPATNYGADLAYVNYYGGFLCGMNFQTVGDGPVGVWFNEGQPTSYPGTDPHEISGFQTLVNALPAAWSFEPSGQKDGFTSSYEVLYCPS
jgi:hypothetical protein